MKELSIDENKWEELATDRSEWRIYLQATLKVGEKSIIHALENKRRLTKEKKTKNCHPRNCKHSNKSNH